jgi:hypothetical protein
MGRHEPPTNRSFYLSVAASTLRFAIIVVLFVVGVVVINQAFPQGSGGTATIPGGGLPSASGSPSPSASPSASESPRPTASPTVVGVSIAVFNGTGVSGLAADVQTRLINKYGYVEGQPPANAPSTMATTTIYYASNRDKVEAEYLAENDKFFRQLADLQVVKLGASVEVDSSVQLAIYLGNDYAALVG